LDIPPNPSQLVYIIGTFHLFFVAKFFVSDKKAQPEQH
jgi:hypothetical protein